MAKTATSLQLEAPDYRVLVITVPTIKVGMFGNGLNIWKKVIQ